MKITVLRCDICRQLIYLGEHEAGWGWKGLDLCKTCSSAMIDLSNRRQKEESK